MCIKERFSLRRSISCANVNVFSIGYHNQPLTMASPGLNTRLEL